MPEPMVTEFDPLRDLREAIEAYEEYRRLSELAALVGLESSDLESATRNWDYPLGLVITERESNALVE